MKKITALFLSLLIFLMTGCSANEYDTSDIPALSDKYVSSVYPTMPVRVIVPFSEGGGTDVVARNLIAAAEESFTQGVSVENVTGEGGATGMREGANAPADGSVITMITVELVTVPHINPNSGILYDQFRPILMVNSAYTAITVRADAPWNSLEELIEYSKSNTLKVGNSGKGAIFHLASAALAQKAGTTFEDVFFESGSAESIKALKTGEIDVVLTSYPEVSAEVDAGNLKTLAMMAPERLEEIPNIPTVKELGYDVSVGTWRGFAVPKDTPDNIVEELSYILSKAAGSMEFVNFMIDTNNAMEMLNGEDFMKRMESDNTMFKELIKNLDL